MSLSAKLGRLVKGELGLAGMIMGMRLVMLASKLVLSIFIARYLSIEELGLYGLIVGVTSIGQVVMRMGIFTGLAREAVSQEMPVMIAHLRNYVTNTLFAYVIVLPVFMGVGWWFEHPIIAVLVFFTVMAEQFCMDIYTLAINLQRSVFANILLTLQSSFWIILFMGLAYFQEDFRHLEWLLFFWLSAGMLSIGIALGYVRHALRQPRIVLPYGWAWLRERFLITRDLYISEAMSIAGSFADRFIIAAFLGMEITGVYVLFWQITNAMFNLVDAGIIQVHRARFIRAFSGRDWQGLWGQFMHCLKMGVFVVFSMILVAIALLPVLLKVLDKPIAVEHQEIFFLLQLVLIFRIASTTCSAFLYSCHRDRAILRFSLWRNVASLPVMVLMTYSAGLIGVIAVLLSREVLIMVTIRNEIPKIRGAIG